MKAVVVTLAVLAAAPALAETPNRVTQPWPDFVEASGCVIKPNAKGQLNLYAADGGNCPASVVTAFNGVGSRQGIHPGPDGIVGTADDYSVSISDN